MKTDTEALPKGDVKDSVKGSPTSDSFKATVNGKTIKLTDPMPTGRQILAEAGFEPADSVTDPAPQSHDPVRRNLEETIDLREEGKVDFRAFESDRVYRFD